MLLAADLAIILGCNFEKFESPIGREKAALLAEALHLSRCQRLEIYGYLQVLIQNLHRIDAADRGRNRQAHRVAQPLLRCHRPVLHELAAAA